MWEGGGAVQASGQRRHDNQRTCHCPVSDPENDAERSGDPDGHGEEEHADLGQAAAATRHARRSARQLHAQVGDDFEEEKQVLDKFRN